MIGLPLGLLYGNAVEWVVHRYLLHDLGKKKSSIFSFHWHKHHKSSRRHGMYDPDYEKPFYDLRSRGKEVGGIGLIVLAHLPLVSVAPWFAAAVAYCGVNYLYRHERSHLDVEWGKKHMRSHYDHHMGKNQDSNWCVTRPWFDWVMGTREHFHEPARVEQKRRQLAEQAAVGRQQQRQPLPAPVSDIVPIAANDVVAVPLKQPSMPPAA